MGRHQENPVRIYFEYDRLTNRSACRVEGCKVVIKGNHAGNMQRHMQSCHKDLHDCIFAGSSRKDINVLDMYSDQPNKRLRLQMPNTLDNMIQKTPKINVSLTPELLKVACTELVTVNGHPFSIFEDSGFRKIIDPLLEGMEHKIVITPENIKENVLVVATNLRAKIKRELKGKLLSLKVDAVTQSKRSILGVNVQFILEESIILRTLAIREIKGELTSSHIALIITDILKDCDIDLKQVFSIVIDNGANMLKIGSLLSEKQRDEYVTDGVKERYLDENNDEEKANECSSVEIDAENYNLTTELGSCPTHILTDNRYSSILQNIPCAAHTLQLSVEDALRDKNTSALIVRARNVCRKLRTISVLSIIKRMKLAKPIVDCPTRWHSTHIMLERLIALQTFCQDMSPTIKELHLTDSDWTEITNIVNALQPAKIATKNFQSCQVLFGDFYGMWLTCKIDTEKIGSCFSNNLVKFMNEREKLLLNNEAVLAAILLDPRFKVVLTETQVATAKQYIIEVSYVLKRLNFETIHRDMLSEYDSSTSPEEDEVEKILKQRDKDRRIPDYLKESKSIGLQLMLNAYYDEPRQKRDTCVLKYWTAKEHSMKELYDIARNIISFPVTQISVERAFSALKFILSSQRTGISEELLEDVLLIRLNNSTV